MPLPEAQAPNATETAEPALRRLYQSLLSNWNVRDAEGYAALFEENGFAVGFDGSQHLGRDTIAKEIGQIFNDHKPGRFVAKVRETRALNSQIGMLRAVASMVPVGASDLKPETNMIQTVVGVRHDHGWRIAILQTTPAQFHGRPELAQELTEELRELL
jgi:uncharacterized protein (TIGR02246 family)